MPETSVRHSVVSSEDAERPVVPVVLTHESLRLRHHSVHGRELEEVLPARTSTDYVEDVEAGIHECRTGENSTLLCVWEVVVAGGIHAVRVKEEEGLVLGPKSPLLQGGRESVKEVQIKVLETAVLVVGREVVVLNLKRPRLLSAWPEQEQKQKANK